MAHGDLDPTCLAFGGRPDQGAAGAMSCNTGGRTVDKQEIAKLQDYLRRKFGNTTIKLTPNPRRREMIEVNLGDEQIGTLYKDVEDGETSYTVTISILDIDLEE